MKKHMPHRRYDLDDGFFDSINTELKAYWLGFITADGCIKTGQGKSLVQVKLMASDAGHLDKLKAALDTERPLIFAPQCGVSGPTAMLLVTSPPMVAALAALGVTPRKSATVNPWAGSPDLMPHYWRGLFDGDGCISREAARNKWSLTLCGSLPCVEMFAAWARDECGGTSPPYRRSNIWYWKVAGLGRPQALARALYVNADSGAALDRKLTRARDLLAFDPDAVRREAYARRDAMLRARRIA